MKGIGYSLPAKFGYFTAGWLYLHSHQDTTAPGTREISLEEWNATPSQYRLHPDLHPKIFSRVPGQRVIPNYREELFHESHYKEHDPSLPHGAHAH